MSTLIKCNPETGRDITIQEGGFSPPDFYGVKGCFIDIDLSLTKTWSLDDLEILDLSKGVLSVIPQDERDARDKEKKEKLQKEIDINISIRNKFIGLGFTDEEIDWIVR